MRNQLNVSVFAIFSIFFKSEGKFLAFLHCVADEYWRYLVPKTIMHKCYNMTLENQAIFLTYNSP